MILTYSNPLTSSITDTINTGCKAHETIVFKESFLAVYYAHVIESFKTKRFFSGKDFL